jgi:hypothetical protein
MPISTTTGTRERERPGYLSRGLLPEAQVCLAGLGPFFPAGHGKAGNTEQRYKIGDDHLLCTLYQVSFSQTVIP